jgi:hypothetical protein
MRLVPLAMVAMMSMVDAHGTHATEAHGAALPPWTCVQVARTVDGDPAPVVRRT